MLNTIAALAGLAYASYTDLKETIVPDWLNYLLIAFGILYHAYLSAITASFVPIGLSLMGTALAFAFAYLLWRIGAWAGGDVKLFTALGALTPGTNLLLPFVILINSVAISFPFLVAYIFAKTVFQKRLHKVFRGMLLHGTEQGLLLGAFSAGFLYLLPDGLAWASALLVAVAFLLPPYLRYGLALLIGIPALASYSQALPIFAASAAIALFWQAISYGREHALRQRIPLSRIREGMIAAETVYAKGGKAAVFHPSWRQKLSLFEPKHTIVSAYQAAGIGKGDIAKLKKYGVRSLWIKEGMPLVPLLFFGALAAYALGDLVSLAISYL